MTRGGVRKGAGAKRKDDPKVQIAVYVNQSVIDNMGGREILREFIMNQINVFKKQ